MSATDSKSENPVYRIWFSSNDFDSHDVDNRRYFLNFPLSIDDLAAIPDGPKAGMQVIIYETGEMEMEAELEFSEEWDCWVARANHNTIVYHPETLLALSRLTSSDPTNSAT